MGVGVLVLGFLTSNQTLDPSFFSLEHPQKPWRFRFSDGSEVPLPNVSSLLNHIEGKKQIHGSYIAEFDLPRAWFDQVKGNSGVFLQSAGGLKSVLVQGTKIHTFLEDSYSDVGPVILIPENILKDSNKIKVEIEIDSLNHLHMGFWKGAPILGNLDKLQIFRDRKTVFLKNFPLVLSSVDFLLGLFLVWLGARLRNPGPVFHAQIVFLFCLSAFFFSLSGAVREISPFVGSVIHYPLNVVLCWSLTRLVLRISNSKKKHINYADTIYSILFCYSVGEGLRFSVRGQIISVIFAKLIIGFYSMKFVKNKKNMFEEVSFFIFTLVSIFYFSDSVRLLSTLLSWNYPIEFSNRYTAHFLLLIPVSFLAHQLIQNVSEASRRKAFEELALQVVHDIRSPLAALEMVSQDFRLLSEETRVLSRGAIDRISDISNILLREHRRYSYDLLDESHVDRSSIFLEPIIEAVVSEKRIEYRNRVGLQIFLNRESLKYGCFSEVNSREFKRVLSNLINNSAEAILGKGTILVSLEKLEATNQVQISVQDNGIGIPEDILPQLFEKGKTFGKKDGSGLGLYHAKQVVESWDGELLLKSQPGHGACVQIKLALSQPASWFVPEIRISNRTRVIVVDDDQTIHQIWQERLGGVVQRIEHLTTPEALIQWAAESKVDSELLVLCDYEFNQTRDGISLLLQLGLMNQSILVTSRSEKEVLDRAEKYHLRVLPKGMAGTVPLLIGSNK